jgi:cobalt-zinc-cadmium efflux system membrane fusion protein
VEAGDVLVVLRSVALGETRAAIDEAQAELREAEAHFERQEQLVEEGIGAQRTLDEARRELETIRARVRGLGRRARVYGSGGRGDRTTIRSPIDGEILARHATVGEVVRPGRMLFEVADLSEVWVMGSVFAQDAQSVRAGADAVLTLRTTDERYEGSLDYVAPALDEHTRTLPVRMVLPNPTAEGERSLRPGLFGTLHVESRARGSSERAAGLAAVPTEAVHEIDGQSHVFVPGEEEGSFVARPVVTGRQSAGRVAILDGLRPGERYVDEGAFTLLSEARRELLGGHHH